MKSSDPKVKAFLHNFNFLKPIYGINEQILLSAIQMNKSETTSIKSFQKSFQQAEGSDILSENFWIFLWQIQLKERDQPFYQWRKTN